jgi:hypothetical protein
MAAWRRWYWLDDRRLLVMEDRPPSGFAVYALDSQTGRRTVLSALEKTLSTLGHGCRLEPSPDGSWVVALSWTKAPHTHWLVSAGTGRVASRKPGTFFVGWLPDSCGWLAGATGKVRGINRLGVDGSQTQYTGLPAVPGTDLGVTPAGNLLVGEYNPYGRDPLKIREVVLATGTVTLWKEVPLPPACLPSEVTLSRDRTRLACLVRPSPAPPLLSWMLPAVPDENTVWVRDVNGSEWRQVGRIPVQYGVDYDSDVSVEWMPGGRSLSVAYRKKLYVVPVD